MPAGNNPTEGLRSHEGPSSRVAFAVPTAAGLTSVVGQVVLLREVIVLYNGNELSSGIVLAAWLLWTAAGAALMERLLRRFTNVVCITAIVECLCGISLVATIVVLRGARAWLQTVPGESLGPVTSAFVAFAGLAMFCGFSGCLFTLAVQMIRSQFPASTRSPVGYAYLAETAGSALGGILTSFLLLRFFASFQIAIIAATMNFCLASWLAFRLRRSRAIATVLVVSLGIAALTILAPRVEMFTQQRIWKGFTLVASHDSIYGRLEILSSGGISGLYENGGVLANIPDPASAEETVHYAMLEHPAPRRVLLIGGGMNGSIAEALKHPSLQRLDYVELDPALIDMYRRYFAAGFASAFADTRVHVHNADGRHYLKQSTESFDEILLSIPDPDNAQLNRFFTEEFFQIARSHLAPAGLLSLQLRSSEESVGPELAEFLRCIHYTLQRVFPYVAVIPGDTLHLFGAMQPQALTEDPRILIDRLRSRHLHTLYVSEYAIPFRMMPDRMDQIHDLLRSRPDTPLNRDFHPAAYYFAAVLWSAQFRSAYSHLLQAAAHVFFANILLFVAALSLGLILAGIRSRRTRTEYAALWSVAAAGNTLMALQILILLAFQSVYGHVYHELAMLIAMFMAGMSIACWFGIACFHNDHRKRLLRVAACNQALLAASAPLLLFVVGVLSHSSASGHEKAAAEFAFPLLAFLCGIPGGLQFSLASGIYQHDRQAKASLSTLYAIDLVGGCIGALVLTGFFIPVFGFWSTAWITSAVALPPAIAALVASSGFSASANESRCALQTHRQ